MKIGVVLRNMGPSSQPETLVSCAREAEAAGIDDLWVTDHLAIPPDDAEGSGGRYLDPLATLAYLAGVTSRIGLGTGVLNLPYRPPLPTAKQIATVQELSGGRLRLGVGLGWMHAEFRALGVDRRRRGRLTDETLAFLRQCFAADDVVAHGQPFLFLPRPAPPPIFVGGSPPHALTRTVRYGDGWMPMAADPETLRPSLERLGELAQAAGRSDLQLLVMTQLPLEEPARARERLAAWSELGATGLVIGLRYADGDGFQRALASLTPLLA